MKNTGVKTLESLPVLKRNFLEDKDIVTVCPFVLGDSVGLYLESTFIKLETFREKVERLIREIEDEFPEFKEGNEIM